MVIACFLYKACYYDLFFTDQCRSGINITITIKE